MSESTLSVTHTSLASEVGALIGYGRTAANWSADQITEIDEIIKSGLRQFYYPPILPGEMNTHEWSFLTPTTSITIWPTTTGTVVGSAVYVSPSSTITVAADSFYPSMIGKSFVFDTSGTGYVITGYTSTTVIVVTGDASAEAAGDTFTITTDSNYILPDNFGGIEGKFTFEPNDGYFPIDLTSEMQIRTLRQRAYADGSTQSRPCKSAVRPQTTTGVAGQKFEVMFWPNVDAVYVISYRFRVLMDVISTSFPYPYGGMVHGETIIESCLAIAEQRSDDEVNIHSSKFMERLTASIGYDSKGIRPDNLGYNADGSDSGSTLSSDRLRSVTYNNVLYDGTN